MGIISFAHLWAGRTHQVVAGLRPFLRQDRQWLALQLRIFALVPRSRQVVGSARLRSTSYECGAESLSRFPSTEPEAAEAGRRQNEEAKEEEKEEEEEENDDDDHQGEPKERRERDGDD